MDDEDDMNQLDQDNPISILELKYFQVLLELTKSLVGAIFGEVQLEAVSVLDLILCFLH